MPLIVRKAREKVAEVENYDPQQIKGPTMIFCNVGLLDKQIPQEIKARYSPHFSHKPAFFDDTDNIINLELGITNQGIVLLNEIEALLKKAYTGSSEPAIHSESIYLVEHPLNISRAPA